MLFYIAGKIYRKNIIHRKEICGDNWKKWGRNIIYFYSSNAHFY